MTITAIDESQRKAARVAGFISLFTLLLFKGLRPSEMAEPAVESL